VKKNLLFVNKKKQKNFFNPGLGVCSAGATSPVQNKKILLCWRGAMATPVPQPTPQI
jgi:hypothetical protein